MDEAHQVARTGGGAGPRGGPWAALAVVARDVGRDLARLVVPVECPGCGRPDEVLCAGCARVLDGPVRRCEAGAPRLDRVDGTAPLPVWAVATYVGPLRGVVVAWKDRGRADLGPVLGRSARRLGRAAGEEIAPWPPAAGRLRVVAVPTTARARRRRGADLVAGLADEVAAGLRDAGVPVERVRALQRRAAADQVGLGARARGANVAGVTARGPAGGALHLLVDDVLTTGATLAACARVLERAGGAVLGAVVLAATPPPGVRNGRIEPIRGDTPGEFVPRPPSVPR